MKKIDPLENWRSQHVRESRILTLLELAWPGSEDICRNAIAHLEKHIEDSEPRVQAIDRCLSRALEAAWSALADPAVADRGQLEAFVGALLEGLHAALAEDDTANAELRRQLVPAHLLKALAEAERLSDEVRDAA